MKSEELRVGNFVSYKGVEFKILNGVDIDNHSNLKPIKLNYKWLIDFGFKYTKGWEDSYLKDGLVLYNNPFNDGWTILEIYSSPILHIKVILYVHHLQNLYFDLQKKDLIVNKVKDEKLNKIK